jgi:hypothetical protein
MGKVTDLSCSFDAHSIPFDQATEFVEQAYVLAAGEIIATGRGMPLQAIIG